MCGARYIGTATPVPIPEANPHFDGLEFDVPTGNGYRNNDPENNNVIGDSGDFYGNFHRYRNEHFYPPIAVLAG